MNIQNPRKNNILEQIEEVQIDSMQKNEPNQINSFARPKMGSNSMSARASMIMQQSRKMNSSKKRNVHEFMGQSLLDVEKVMNNSQTFLSIPDDQIGQINEGAEINKALDLKYGGEQRNEE